MRRAKQPNLLLLLYLHFRFWNVSETAGPARNVRFLGSSRSRISRRQVTMAGIDLLQNAEPAWRAAQVQAEDLLGEDALIAVMDIANHIMDPIA
jgi:hypothetical protein